MKKIGVCLVGCGSIGAAHARTYSFLKDEVDLFLCDSAPERAESLKVKYGAKEIFSEYYGAISDEKVDLIDICLPHDTHLEPVKLACGLNKHVLLEKPVARNLEEADEVLKAVKESTGKFMVAECWRFYPHAVRAHELIQKGEIGDVFFIKVDSLAYFVPSGWRRNKQATGGGALIDRGVHFVDILLYLGGRVEKVFAECTHKAVPEMEGEDTAIGILKFEYGAIGQINVSWGTRNPPFSPWFVVYGSKGTIYGRQGLRMSSTDYPRGQEQTLDERVIPDAKMIDLTIRHFVDCVRRNRVPSFTPEMARQDLEVVQAMHLSWTTGEVLVCPCNECTLVDITERLTAKDFSSVKRFASLTINGYLEDRESQMVREIAETMDRFYFTLDKLVRFLGK